MARIRKPVEKEPLKDCIQKTAEQTVQPTRDMIQYIRVTMFLWTCVGVEEAGTVGGS